METVGNRVANEYCDANLPADLERPDPTNSHQMANGI
jgi:hypothetical protein